MLPSNTSVVKPNSIPGQQISGAPLQVVVFPNGQNTAGLYPGQSAPRACPVVTLEEAMLQPHNTDVHIQALEANVLLPYRVTKAALAAPGALWRKTHTVLDFDPPKSILVNGKAPEAWHTLTREKLAELKMDHPGVLVYRTWKGYQVCWLLPEPMDLTDATYRTVHTYNHAVGLHVERVYGLVYDRAATSPLHLFRVPRALRSAEKDYRSFLPLSGTTLGVAAVVPSVEDMRGAQRIMEKGGSKITKDQDLMGSQRNLPLIDHVVGSQTPPPCSPIDHVVGSQTPPTPPRTGEGGIAADLLKRDYLRSVTYLSARRADGSDHVVSPNNAAHSANTDGTSSTTIIGGTLHSSHESSGDSAELLRKVRAEYHRGGYQWYDSELTVASYAELTAADFVQRGGRPTLYVLTGPTGTGKTTAVARAFAGKPAFVVQGHIALAQELGGVFGVPVYDDAAEYNSASGVSTTCDSLYKYGKDVVAGRVDADTCVFIDELGSTLRCVFGATQIKTRSNYLNWRALQALLNRAVAVAADATFTAADVRTLRLLMPNLHIVRVTATSAANRYDGFKITPVADAVGCERTVLAGLTAGERVAAVTTSAKFALGLADLAQKAGHRVGIRIGGQSVEEALTPANAADYDLLILSPAAAKGLSFTTEVSFVVGYFPFDPRATCHGLGSPSVLQMLGRFRNVSSKRFYVHASNRQTRVSSLDVINASVEALDAASVDDKSFSYAHFFDADFRRAYAVVQQAEAVEGFQVRDTVFACLMSEGAVIADDVVPGAAPSERSARGERMDALEADLAGRIASAETVLDAPKTRAKTEAERLSRTRSEVVHALSQDVTAEDVREYLDGADKDGVALAASALVETHTDAVGRRDAVAAPNVIRNHDVPRARAVRAMLRACGLEGLLSPTESPPVVDAAVVRAGADAYFKANADLLSALRLPVGRCGTEMLNRNLHRLGLRLERNTRASTVTVSSESWQRAWKWAFPAAERMLSRVRTATMTIRPKPQRRVQPDDLISVVAG